MSAIAGIVRFDESRPPQVLEAGLEDSLRAMTDVLAHRGPDGASHWADEEEGVALGHLALHATPEAAHETIPLRHEEHGLVLTSDARIDNREELGRELGLQVLEGDPEGVGDSDLILAAYRKWGAECAQHLLGDFAFAVWDGKKQELFCARDHVGVKPLYFFHSDEMFAFATEIKALLELPGVPREVNEERIAKYLMVAYDSHADTLFAHIERLPSAHTLRASRRGIEIDRYWDLRDAPDLSGLSESEAEARFREVLFEAVRCRLRAPRTSGGRSASGAFLSGGLDSTSVACIAREIRREQAGESKRDAKPEEVPVFSAVFAEVKESDERPFIEAALEGGGLEPHWIVGENRSPLMELEKLLWHLDEPVIGTNLGSSWTHFRPAREMGLRVMLDGHGGDETVGFGKSRLSELFQKRQWRSLWLELRAMERNGLLEGGPSAARTMRGLLGRAFGPARLWLRLRNGIARRLPNKNIGQGKNGASYAVAEAAGSNETGPGEAAVPWQERLSPEFARRIGARAMYEKWKPSEPRLTQGERAFNEATLSAPLQALAFEELDHAAAASQIEARYPMWDKRLVELCLGLPSHHKLRDGWTRSILRRSLDGVLPPLVQWRAGKNDFTHEAWRGLRVHNADWLKKMIDKQLKFVSSYTDADKAADAARQIMEAQVPTAGLSQTVVRTASLEAWLAMQTMQRQQEPRRESKQDLQDEREEQERQEEPSLLAHV